MTDLIDLTAKVATEWWANLLEEGDKAAFSACLAPLIGDRLRKHGICLVACDYDPKDILLEAVRAAGIECRGHACSAAGILPYKAETLIKPGIINPFGKNLPLGSLYIAHDVGHDGADKTVTVVARITNQGGMEILSIKEG